MLEADLMPITAAVHRHLSMKLNEVKQKWSERSDQLDVAMEGVAYCVRELDHHFEKFWN